MAGRLTSIKKHAADEGYIAGHSSSKGCSGFGVPLLDLLKGFASVVGSHIWEPDPFLLAALLLPKAALCLVRACE